jgi:hypothetical protein
MIKLGMFARNYRAFAGALGLVFFLTACGDLGMVLPSQGSYRVNAQVDGDYTLDAYSVVAKASKIRPYFVNSVVNDPDVRGLTVFVQDYSGAIVSRKVHYLLDREAKETQLAKELPVTAPPEEAPKPGAEAGPEDAPEEVPRDEPPEGEGEAVLSGEAGTDPWDDAPELTGEAPQELSGFDDPPAETPPDLPTETPADIFDGTGDGGAWADTLAATETGASAEAETASDTFWDAGGADFSEADGVDTDMAGAEAAALQDSGTIAAGADPAGADAGDGGAEDPEAAGADIAGADADTQDAGTNAADPDGTAVPDAEAAATTATDAAGADAGDPGIAGVKTAGTNTADTDAAADTAVPAAPPAEIVKSPIPEDETVQVKQLDQYLPAFLIVEDLDIGRHNLVFQVMGEKEILYRTFKPIYFIGDAKFTLGEIQSFLPVAITGGRLIPPGINVMLGTEISADPRLDPYIIWHSGKKIIAQGRLSDGANYLLWKTPEQTGFHSIRAEVFPLLPSDRMPGNMIGKIKELSLPVSSKSEGIRHFSDPSGEFISWYQLWGTLDDAKAPSNAGRRLASLYAQSPRWMPFGGMYGLLVGRDDSYALPGMPFKLSGDAEGRGRIWLHLAALSEGAIVNIRFAGGETPAPQEAGGSPLGTADLDLAFTGDALILRIASNDLSQEESLELHGDETNGFITLLVDFVITRDRLDAELRLEDAAKTTGLLSLALAAPVSGEGTVRFGSSEYSGYRRGVKRTVLGEAGKYGAGTMVLNELALSYARLPVPPQEEESGVSESLPAEEEDSSAETETPFPTTL